MKIKGSDQRHSVFLYTLSTCAWCNKTKDFLKEKGIECEYVDVDLCNQADYEKIRKDISSRGGGIAFPIIIIDDKHVINGFQIKKIKEVLEI
jgi:glutaredoxin